MKQQDSAESGARRPATALRSADRPSGDRLRGDPRADGPDSPDPERPVSAQDAPASPAADRRNQSNRVPNITSLVCMLIGLSDILSVIDSAWHRKLARSGLHKFVAVVPGTVFAVTGTAGALTG